MNLQFAVGEPGRGRSDKAHLVGPLGGWASDFPGGCVDQFILALPVEARDPAIMKLLIRRSQPEFII
jgi:hypothetical protein